MTTAALKAYGYKRCKCGEAKFVITDDMRAKMREQCPDGPLPGDRCLACESYDAVIVAQEQKDTD